MSQQDFVNLGLPFMTYEDFSTSPSEDSNEGQDSDNEELVIGSADVKPVKRRSRRPPSTPAKRATHNAIERARRESLNGKFLELAKALPNMPTVKRPSKSSIVIKSLEYVYQVQSRERTLIDEKAALQKEVEDLRARLGLAPSPPKSTEVKLYAQPEYILSSNPITPASSDSCSDSSEFLTMFQPMEMFLLNAPYNQMMGFDWSGLVNPVVQPTFGVFAQ